MTLRQQMIDDVSDVFLDTEEHAETITYNPLGVAGSSIYAVIDDEDVMQAVEQEDGKGYLQTISLYVAVADVATVSVDADTITARGETFTVRSVQGKDEGMMRLTANAWVMMRKSKQGYQRDR